MVNRLPYRERLLQIFQFTIGIGFLWWVLRGIDWSTFLSRIGRLSAGSFAIVVAVSVLGMAAQFITWFVLLREVSQSSANQAFRADLVIRFVNSLLPSRVTGRSLAPLVLRFYTGASWSDATAITTAHTGLYALLYGLGASVGFILVFDKLSSGIVLLLILSTLTYLCVGLVIVSGGFYPGNILRTLRLFGLAVERIPFIRDRISELIGTAIEFTEDTINVFRTVVSSKRPLLWFTISWLGALMIFPSIRFVVLLSAFGANFEPLVFLPFVVLVAYSVTILPVTPGGIGVTEVTAIIVFVGLGFPHHIIVATVFIDRFIGVYLPALLGWYPFIQTDFRWVDMDDNEGL